MHRSDDSFSAFAKRDMHFCLRVMVARRERDRHRHREGLPYLVRRDALKEALWHGKVRACHALGRPNVLLGRREAVSVMPRAIGIPRILSGESRAGEVNVSCAVRKVTAIDSNEPRAVPIGERVDERLHVTLLKFNVWRQWRAQRSGASPLHAGVRPPYVTYSPPMPTTCQVPAMSRK